MSLENIFWHYDKKMEWKHLGPTTNIHDLQSFLDINMIYQRSRYMYRFIYNLKMVCESLEYLKVYFLTLERSQLKSPAIISMRFVVSKYCNNWKKVLHVHGLFSINIKVNTLTAKRFFVKLKIDTPIASNFLKRQHHFYIRKLNLKVYFHSIAI